MLKSIFRGLPRLSLSPHRALTECLDQLTRRFDQIDSRLGRIDRLASRLHRDVDRLRLHAGIVLETTRALALLASGQRIYVDPRDRGSGINLLSEGKYEEDDFAVFRRYLRPGAVVLDVGANYGFYSISAAPYVQPGGRVIGFEPNPHIFDLYRQSIYVNGLTGVIEPHRLGVHDTNSSLRFLIDEKGPGGSHIISPEENPPAGMMAIDVPVARLDDYLPSDMVVDLIKIDVEGYEEPVLRGMRDLIARSPDVVILMELFYPFFPNDDAFVSFITFMNQDLGLTISRVGPNAKLFPADAGSLRGTTGNVLLSKQPPAELPDLTIYAVQLHRSHETKIEYSELHWTSGNPSNPGGIIAHGPYVYLPKGYYRLKIDGEFLGEFTCALLENAGDVISQFSVPSGQGFEIDIAVDFDAPSAEIAFWPISQESAEMRFRTAEFRKIG